jgi:NTP pyrophosphatase (non-canonical NTP hydrolase)
MTNQKGFETMTAEVRAVNIEKGWRDDGKTFGDFVSLLSSEVAEALEAFRRWGLADMTGKIRDAYDKVGLEGQPVKPEGVGSELADVLIRYLDTCDVIGMAPYEDPRIRAKDGGLTLDEVASVVPARAIQRGQVPGVLISFGDHMAWLDRCISQMWMDAENCEPVVMALVTIARKYEIDLMAEYERKMAFNRTREFRHGGKKL